MSTLALLNAGKPKPPRRPRRKTPAQAKREVRQSLAEFRRITRKQARAQKKLPGNAPAGVGRNAALIAKSARVSGSLTKAPATGKGLGTAGSMNARRTAAATAAAIAQSNTASITTGRAPSSRATRPDVGAALSPAQSRAFADWRAANTRGISPGESMSRYLSGRATAGYTGEGVVGKIAQGAGEVTEGFFNTPSGIYQLVTNPKQTLKAMGESFQESVQHPLRHPGYTALNAWAAASLGAGAIARGSAAVRAGSVGGAAKALVRTPDPGLREYAPGAIVPELRPALSRYVARAYREATPWMTERRIGSARQYARTVASDIRSARGTTLGVAGKKMTPAQGEAAAAIRSQTTLPERIAAYQERLPNVKKASARRRLEQRILAAQSAIEQGLVRTLAPSHPEYRPVAEALGGKHARVSERSAAGHDLLAPSEGLAEPMRLYAESVQRVERASIESGNLNPDLAEPRVDLPGQLFRGEDIIDGMPQSYVANSPTAAPGMTAKFLADAESLLEETRMEISRLKGEPVAVPEPLVGSKRLSSSFEAMDAAYEARRAVRSEVRQSEAAVRRAEGNLSRLFAARRQRAPAELARGIQAVNNAKTKLKNSRDLLARHEREATRLVSEHELAAQIARRKAEVGHAAATRRAERARRAETHAAEADLRMWQEIVDEAAAAQPIIKESRPGLFYGYGGRERAIGTGRPRTGQTSMGRPRWPFSRRQYTGQGELYAATDPNPFKVQAQRELQLGRNYTERIETWKQATGPESLSPAELVAKIDSGELSLNEVSRGWMSARMKPGTNLPETRQMFDRVFSRDGAVGSMDDLRALAVDAERAGQIRFFDKTTVRPRPFRGEKGTTLSTADTVTHLAKASVLLSKGTGYILPQIPGQIGMLGLQAPVRHVLDLMSLRAPRILHALTPEERATLKAGAGAGISRSFMGAERGISAKIDRVIGKGTDIASAIMDDPFRERAMLAELYNSGYKTAADVKRVLKAEDGIDLSTPVASWPKEARDLMEASMRTDQALAAFRKMTDSERQVVSRIIWFWPWLRASGEYTLKLPGRHPVAAAGLAQIGKVGDEYTREVFGDDVAEAIPGVFPVGRTSDGLPRVVNPVAAGVLSSPMEALNLLRGEAGLGGDISLGQYITPPIKLAGAALHWDIFRQRRIPGNIGSRLLTSSTSLSPYTKLYERLNEGQPEKGWYHYSPRDAIAQVTLGSPSPRTLNQPAVEAWLEEQKPADVRAVNRVRREQETYFTEAKRVGMDLENGRLPKPLRDSFARKAQREVAYAKAGSPTQRERYEIDLKLFQQWGYVTAKDVAAARRWLATASDAEIEKVRGQWSSRKDGYFRRAYLESISYARTALRAKGAVIPD